MAITDYGSLRSTVAAYLHRADLTSNIPDFISMAEWRIARGLRVSALLTTSDVTISGGGSSVAMPSGFVELVNAKLASSGAELHYVPPDTVDRVTGGTVPWAYTLVGSTLVVAPSWTAGGQVSLTYWKKETALSDSNTTNWYVTNCPDALLYGALLEASPFLVNDSRIPVWREFFAEAVNAVNSQYGSLDPHKRMLAYASGSAQAVNAGSDLRAAT